MPFVITEKMSFFFINNKLRKYMGIPTFLYMGFQAETYTKRSD